MKPEPFDPEGARKLLAEAGYPDGFAITLHGPNNRYVNDDQIVQAVAQMLTRVGIATKVETLPFSVYVSRANKVEFSAALLGWGVSTGEATYPLRSLIATYNQAKGLGTWNWGRYSNPQMDALLEQGLATVDNAQAGKTAAAGDRARDQRHWPRTPALPGQYVGGAQGAGLYATHRRAHLRARRARYALKWPGP